jgi:hypothetical protein
MNNFGRDNLMVIAAFRYCLGRRTYIVSDCVAWLREIWPLLVSRDKRLIKKEVDEALSAGRAGDHCDRDEWIKIMELEDGKQ